ncbi:hypothetical protein SAMD00023353_0105350 [Rosellinia necatrix]|uniref:Uncharacterized protein n=1 Tax=Rosellinia necatrix TaxID=77044 RepID=A0A1S7UIF8_ROSNE|nr:hypothetical protein SAMD00023353_0105350 [Rosellinia necatrix]
MTDRNRKFESVHKAIGGIGDGESMRVYYDRICNATDDVPGYLEWSMDQPRPKPAPPSSPETILAIFDSLNFRSIDTISRVITRLSSFELLPLASDDNVTYLVVADPAPLYIQYPNGGGSGSPGDDGGAPSAPVNHSYFLRLKTSEGGGEIPPPKFALTLGRLVKRPVSQYGGPEKLLETNYAVVIDACRDGNPVWLIYNRRPLDRTLGEYPDTPIDPATMDLVFPGALHNPDSLSVMPRLKGWFLGRSLIKPSDIGSWINQRGSKVPVAAEIATRAEVSQVLGVAAAYPRGQSS